MNFIPVVRGWVIRIQADRPLELLFSFVPAPRLIVITSKRGVCFCQRVVNLESALGCGFRFRQCFARGSARSYCLLKLVVCIPNAFYRSLIPNVSALQI